MAEEHSQESGRTPIRLGYLGTMIVFLITAMAGTGFAVGLLLLVWSLLGGIFSGFLLFLTVFSGLVTLIGIIILGLSKEQAPVDAPN
jgi:ABC-type multidrug transport system permease subunit